ncbi:MAG: SPOR domain-containing protein [bacterium]
MKVYKLNLKVSVLIVLTFLFYVGCAAPEKVKRPAPETESLKNFELMDEDFDPLKLNDSIKIEDTDAIDKNYEDVLVNTGESTKDSMVTGYRVQLIQTTNPEEAKDVQRDAVLRFRDEVYRVFDPPFYKVRVGDFVNWYDAEKLQKLAIQKGFREAWVIRTKVNLNKASQWLDELEN